MLAEMRHKAANALGCVLLALALSACGGTPQPTPAPTPDIEATVEARIQEKLVGIEATVEARVAEERAAEAAAPRSQMAAIPGDAVSDLAPTQNGWTQKVCCSRGIRSSELSSLEALRPGSRFAEGD